MKHASVFSGIEGFGLAALWAGIETVFSCEINGFCREVIKRNFPKTTIYEDIRSTDFRQYRGQIDILTGGFPCQPFSVAGQRKGSGDDRYLWPEMLRVIDEVRPTWVIGENVAGITSMVQPCEVISVENHSDLFGEDNYSIETERAEYVIETVCRDLEGIGYSVQPFIIPACAVGAPHKRDRIWIAAHADSERLKDGQEGKRKTICNGNRNCSASEQQGDEQQRRTCEYDRTPSNASNARIKDLQRKWEDGVCKNGYTSNSNSTVVKREYIQEQGEVKFDRCYCGDFPLRWRNFPTVSPIHTRNDGISSELLRQRIREDSMGLLSEKEIDEIFSKANTKLREEGVKASGNAIVPQVAYQIIRAIVEIENNKKQLKK